MYIRSIRIENVRSIAEMIRLIPDGKAAGWHVIIGDNGSGKTTFLRSIALALIGPTEALALRQDWNNWLRRNASSGTINLQISWDPQFDIISNTTEDHKNALEKPNTL